MKYRFIPFFLLFVVQLAFGQSHVAIDSTLINRTDSLVGLSNDLLNASYTDSARQVADYVLQLTKEVNYGTGIGQAYVAMANIYSMNGNNGKAIEHSKLAADLFEKNAAFRKLAIVHYNMGSTLFDDGQYEAALEYAEKAGVHFLKVNDRTMLTNVNANIGAMFIRMKKPLVQTLFKLSEAEKMAREDTNMLTLCQILNNKGIAYVRVKKNLEKAVNVFLESTRLQRQEGIDNDFIKGYSFSGLSDAYFLMREYDLALKHNDIALTVFKQLKYPAGLKDVYETRKNILAMQENYKLAFEAISRLNTLKDTLYNKQRSQQLSQVRTEYETERKEAEIVSLSQQASFQALKIRQKNQIMVIGMIVLLLVIISIYFFYKQRSTQRKQSHIELEQRFLRSQLNPHFISNALVAVQNFMLKNQTEAASTYLSKFSKLMREILENSRKEFIPVEDEVEMLSNYLDIHKLRMKDSFDYNIEIDKNIDTETDTIPPMFVQPFIENAIEHGIIHANGRGLIEVSFQKEKEYISIEVKDNGSGISRSTLKSKDHNSLSSTIIQERMALFNKTLKKKIQLILADIKNENGEVQGTKVELKVPFSYI